MIPTPDEILKQERQERHNLSVNLPEGEISDPERQPAEARHLLNCQPETITLNSGNITPEKAESTLTQEPKNDIHSQEPAGRVPVDSV